LIHLDIWALVMAKKKARSQTGNLTPDHKKSRIDSTPMRASGVGHPVGKLLMKATTLLQTSSQSKVWAKSYSPAKLWESNLGNFGTPPWESQDKKPFGCGIHEEA
jgi:hypothetical protein